MKKTIIITDSSCDISQELLERNNIRIIPLRVNIGGKEYRDKIDISCKDIFDIIDEKTVKTSLPSLEDLTEVYDKVVEEGYKNVIHISISSALSGTYNFIKLNIEKYQDILNINLIDSKTLSGGLGLLVLRAAELLNTNDNLNEIISEIDNKRTSELGAYVLKTLTYLRRGGRIGLVEGVVGNLLNIKPVIYVNDKGEYDTLNKALGFNKAKSVMLECFIEKYKNQEVDIHIPHADAEDEALKFFSEVKNKLNIKNVYIQEVSPVLGVHTGKGLIGIIALPR